MIIIFMKQFNLTLTLFVGLSAPWRREIGQFDVQNASIACLLWNQDEIDCDEISASFV